MRRERLREKRERKGVFKVDMMLFSKSKLKRVMDLIAGVRIKIELSFSTGWLSKGSQREGYVSKQETMGSMQLQRYVARGRGVCGRMVMARRLSEVSPCTRRSTRYRLFSVCAFNAILHEDYGVKSIR